MNNLGDKKTKRIVSNLKNVFNQLYNHYAIKMLEEVGVRLSNVKWSCTSSTSVGVGSGTFNKVQKNALKNFHSFRARINLMQFQTKIE
jgi:hypothetical protein